MKQTFKPKFPTEKMEKIYSLNHGTNNGYMHTKNVLIESSTNGKDVYTFVSGFNGRLEASKLKEMGYFNAHYFGNVFYENGHETYDKKEDRIIITVKWNKEENIIAGFDECPNCGNGMNSGVEMIPHNDGKAFFSVCGFCDHTGGDYIF